MSIVPHNPQPVSTYDWDTDIHTYDPRQMDAAQIWRTAVALAATNARKALPDSNGRIDKAVTLVLTGAVELLDGGKARVASQTTNGETTYLLCNGSCECQDFARAPQGQCKHRIARGLVIRAIEIAKQLGQAPSLVTVQPQAMLAPQPSIPSEFLATIQGKQFVLFSGLLTLATQQGLLSLTEEFTHVTDTYVLAQARAEFHDGRVFRGAADSTPDNVGKQVKPHWRRMALTRAKARCLRDALNVNLVAVEELD